MSSKRFPNGACSERTARGWRSFLVIAQAVCLVALPDSAYPAQEPAPQDPSATSRSAPRRVAAPMDWTSENFSLVAAAAEQIEAVLAKEPGLLVELKRLVAREASESGQILEESDLADRTISERLRHDTRFRAKATRLLERYGFLIPQPNPNSPVGREQERAERVARAAADAAAAQHPCADPNDPACAEAPSLQNAAPQQKQTRAMPQAPLPQDSGSLLGPGIEPALPGGSGIESRPPALRHTVHSTSTGDELDPRPRPLPSDGLSASAALAGIVPEAGRPPEQPVRSVAATPLAQPSPSPAPAVLQPVELARPANPYADIPSLYDLYVQARPRSGPLERFGLDVFRRDGTSPDSIPMDLPVGPDYVLGPGDGLAVDLWGGVSQRLFRTVDREGRVSLPEAGPLLVSGRTLGEVQQAVQRALRTQFRDVSADVSLLRLRTVRVYVVGEVTSPGAYDISSLSTPLNAIFAAGGITPRGSLRLLRHYRGKQLVEAVDAYDLLLHGLRGDLRNLENGDTLLVPSLGPQVAVDGMVRRPAIYELRGEKTLAEVLDLAGGILPAAALRHIEVQRLEAHEKRTMLSLDLGETSDREAIRRQLAAFEVRDGDEVHIFPIAPYNAAAVYLQGHVLRPGRYAYKPGMRLADLVSSYRDLLPEPAEHYAEIVRLRQPDSRPVVESFDLAAALANPAAAPKLEALDTVRIFSRYDFESAPTVAVGGEVRAPGQYRTSGEAHLRDAIYLAGGLTPDAARDSAQLFRMQPDGSLKILSIHLAAALSGDPLENVLLQPRDRIVVHRSLYRVDPPSVYVKGEVARPGRYPLAANMQLADLVRAAGGPVRSADLENGELTRYRPGDDPARAGEHVRINVSAVLGGDATGNVPLADGDVLTIPQLPGWKDLGAAVTLGGEVKNPGVYGIRPGERLGSLLKRAGGFLPTAYPQAAILLRRDVRDLQERSRQELIQRLEQEAVAFKVNLSATPSEQLALQQAAYAQRERLLEGVKKASVSGRLVVRLDADLRAFENSPNDIELRAGDTLEIPKRPGFVLVIGQVHNSNAITYEPRKNAGWYLGQAGGATHLGDKKAMFIIRTDGSVESSHTTGWWRKSVLGARVGPGDTIVVPEKPVGGGAFWRNLATVAQVAQSASIAALVASRR